MTPRSWWRASLAGTAAGVTAVCVAVALGAVDAVVGVRLALAVAVVMSSAAVLRMMYDRGVVRVRRRRRESSRSNSHVATRLAQMERVSQLWVTSGDVHFHLRPVLRDLAKWRLATRGVDLDTDPSARALLGDELFDVVRPDRPAPTDRLARGLRSIDELDVYVRRLENL